MEETALIFVTVFFIFFGIFGFAISFAIRQRRKLREQFAAFAAKLGCQAHIPEGFFGGLPSCNGSYRKRNLVLYMFTRSSGSGKNRRTTTYTAFTLDVNNPEGFEFNIYEQGFFTTLLTKFGMQDIQIGDEAFDKEFIIKSNNENMVRSMLSPMIMSKFIDFAQRYTAFGIKLNGSQFYYEAPISIASEKIAMQFEEKINFFCDVADQIEEINRHRRK
jgi:hypothetical protein